MDEQGLHGDARESNVPHQADDRGPPVQEKVDGDQGMLTEGQRVRVVNDETGALDARVTGAGGRPLPTYEQLVAINSRLLARQAEMEENADDPGRLLNSTDIAAIFLDPQLRIRRSTPAADALLGLLPSDIGRPLLDRAPLFTDPGLEDDAAAVSERLIPTEREIASPDGRWFVRRVLPYRIADKRIDGVVVTFVDITRHHAAETAKRRGEMSYHQTIESIRDHAIIMLDTEGSITGWSKGAGLVLGFAPEEMLGQHIRKIFVEEDREQDMSGKELARAAATGTALDERWHQRKDGSRFWASGTVNALRDDEGNLTGFVKILRDHTAQKELTENLEQARANAEQANRSKDQFIATISHELRTPLSIIMMWSKMMRQGDLDDEDLDEAVEAIARSAESQSRLIEDLLDSSRIAAGKLSIDIGPVNLGEIITQAVDSFWPAMESKEIECSVEIGEGLDAGEWDGGRILQVVRNLVSNAVKFTPRGGRIEVGAGRDGEWVEVTVSDSGVGIDPAFLPRVFERFAQGDSARDRPHGGLGLGLSIVQSIVEMHGGSITPFSDGHGKGTRFIVHMPLRSPKPGNGAGPAPAAPASAGALGRLDNLRVLLLEDQPDAAAVIGASLRRVGAEVAVAGLAVDALGLFESGPFDLIVSDIGLPDIDGFEFIRRVRRAESRLGRTPCPAVALTAYGGSENQCHALEVGFNAFLVKPSDPEALIAELGRLTTGSGSAESV